MGVLTRAEAARALRVSVRTIDRLREQGELTSYVSCSSVRIVEDSIAAYLQREFDRAAVLQTMRGRPPFKWTGDSDAPLPLRRRDRIDRCDRVDCEAEARG